MLPLPPSLPALKFSLFEAELSLKSNDGVIENNDRNSWLIFELMRFVFGTFGGWAFGTEELESEDDELFAALLIRVSSLW